MTRAKFIDYVKENCANYGIECYIGKGRNLNLGENARSEGYFDAANKRLAFSQYSKITLIAHEFCHLVQYVTMGEKRFLSMPDLELELDCEKKTIELIKKLSLRVSMPRYIQVANAYVMSYGVAPDPFQEFKINPRKVGEIVNKMSTKFYATRVYQNPPQWFRELCKIYCY